MARRSGYTLLELMLVVALIVVVAGLTYPLADTLLTSNRLSAGADQLKSQLVRIRSHAMAEGRVYTLKLMDGTGRFMVEPDEETEITVEGGDPPYCKEDELPEGVVFVKNVEALHNGSEPLRSATYEIVLRFYPDGTAKGAEGDNVQIVIGTVRGGARGFGIRGLTGAIFPLDLSAENRP